MNLVHLPVYTNESKLCDTAFRSSCTNRGLEDVLVKICMSSWALFRHGDGCSQRRVVANAIGFLYPTAHERLKPTQGSIFDAQFSPLAT